MKRFEGVSDNGRPGGAGQSETGDQKLKRLRREHGYTEPPIGQASQDAPSTVPEGVHLSEEASSTQETQPRKKRQRKEKLPGEQTFTLSMISVPENKARSGFRPDMTEEERMARAGWKPEQKRARLEKHKETRIENQTQQAFDEIMEEIGSDIDI